MKTPILTQNILSSITAKFAICFVLLSILSGSYAQNHNYLKTVTYKKPSTQVTIDENDPSQAQVQMTYFDGLGRPIQQVAHKASHTGKDVILHIDYDAYGRKTREYLPYVRTNPSLQFDSSASDQVVNFYSTNNVSVTGNPDFATTDFPFSQLEVENSPLSRVFKQAAPGEAWSMGSGKEIKFDYDTNAGNEVILFRAVASWSSSLGHYTVSLINDGFYTPGQLMKSVLKDEHWSPGDVNKHTTVEYTDKEGKVVLTRTFEGNHTLDTYMVYDQFGNLSYVIPPAVQAGQTITQTQLDQLCYQYRYDHRNRLVIKKQPEKNEEYLVYDKLNRVVMTGPVKSPFNNLTSNGWLIIKYDAFNRVVMTGFRATNPSNATRINFQTDRDAQTEHFHEYRLENGVTTIYTTSGTTFEHSYSNVAFPTSNFHVLTINYYDNYTYHDAPTVAAEIEGQPVYYNNTQQPKGLPTGKITRVLFNTTSQPSSRRESSYAFYDIHSRPIRIYQRNHETNTVGYTLTDMKYDFEGKTEYAVTRHKRINSNTEQVIKNSFTYSPQGRVLEHVHKINNLPDEKLAEYQYDELGRVISKSTGVNNNTPLQQIDYRYNIRGWLTHINDVEELQKSGAPLDVFAFKIHYNDVSNDVNNTVKALYNGNISEVFWRTANDNVLRSYSFRYDDINRLKDAYYHKNNVLTQSYNEHITYDKNGNIQTLKRNGVSDLENETFEIDDLVYTYQAHSNRLIKVTDGTAAVYNDGFRDGADLEVEYEYDEFGNMTRDYNKGIEIKYNHLNLPMEILFADGNKIQYVYNAEGKRLEKHVIQGSTTVVTKYLEGFQYVGNVLQYLPTAEGYAARQGSSYTYVYQYKDHLGNVRLSYSRDPQTGLARIVEENNYYPYGLQHSGYNNDVWLNQANTEGQKITFNSRELQNEFDLFVVAMDFRQYDPALGRFTAMDLLAEKYLSFTPYQFGNNNPVYWADPSGLEGMPGWLQDIWDASPSNAATTWTNNNNGGFTITNIVYYPLSLDAGGSGGGGGFGFDGSSLGVGVGTTYSFMTGVLTTPQGNFINFGANSWHSAEGIMLEGITVTGRIGNLNVPYGQLIGSILANMPNSGGDVGRGSNFPSFWSALSFGLGFGEIARNAVSFVQYGASAGAVEWALKNGKYYHRGKLYWQGNYPKVTQAMKNSLSGGKFLNSLGKRLTVTSGLVTVIDGSVNGWKNHHTADLVVTGGLYLLAAATPVGWVVGGLYTLADLGVQAYTGKSITQNIFD